MTRSITARDGEQFATRLIKHGTHWVVNLESETFKATLPLTPFLTALLVRKLEKGIKA